MEGFGWPRQKKHYKVYVQKVTNYLLYGKSKYFYFEWHFPDIDLPSSGWTSKTHDIYLIIAYIIVVFS